MGKNQHVTPHPKGGWQVKGAGNSRATARTSTQKKLWILHATLQSTRVPKELFTAQTDVFAPRTLTETIRIRRKAN